MPLARAQPNHWQNAVAAHARKMTDARLRTGQFGKSAVSRSAAMALTVERMRCSRQVNESCKILHLVGVSATYGSCLGKGGMVVSVFVLATPLDEWMNGETVTNY